VNTAAYGEGAWAVGSNATAIGEYSSAWNGVNGTGTNMTAVGANSKASANGATATGSGAVASGTNSSAFGYAATASGASASAFGWGATATHAGSTAVGAGATTTRANQVVLGGAGSSVTIGDIAASTAAQTGTIYIATTDAGGTLGRGLAVSEIALKSDLAGLQDQIDTLFDLQDQHIEGVKRANEGVAMAMAMESPALQPDQKMALSGGVGYYEDQGAATMAFTARVSDNASVSAGVGVGFRSGSVGARGGFQIAW
jgi:autotransporter adhesin